MTHSNVVCTNQWMLHVFSRISIPVAFIDIFRSQLLSARVSYKTLCRSVNGSRCFEGSWPVSSPFGLFSLLSISSKRREPLTQGHSFYIRRPEALNFMFMVPGSLVILVFKIPTRCNLFCLFGLFFTTLHVSDAVRVHLQE